MEGRAERTRKERESMIGYFPIYYDWLIEKDGILVLRDDAPADIKQAYREAHAEFDYEYKQLTKKQSTADREALLDFARSL